MNSSVVSRYGLLNIPPEISYLIWGLLMPYDLCLCMTLCHTLNTFLKSDLFWKEHLFRIVEYAYDNPFLLELKNCISYVHFLDLYTTPWSDSLSNFERYKRIIKSNGHRHIIYDISTGQLITTERGFNPLGPIDVYRNIKISPEVCIHSVYISLSYVRASSKSHPKSICRHGIGSLSLIKYPKNSKDDKLHYLLRFKSIFAVVGGISDALNLIKIYKESEKYINYKIIDDIPNNQIYQHRHTSNVPWKCLTCNLVHGPGSYLYTAQYRVTRCHICYTDMKSSSTSSYYSCEGCKEQALVHISPDIKLASRTCGRCNHQIDRVKSCVQYR